MNTDDKTIVGTMIQNDPGYERKSNQEDSWFEQIRILKTNSKTVILINLFLNTLFLEWEGE